MIDYIYNIFGEKVQYEKLLLKLLHLKVSWVVCLLLKCECLKARCRLSSVADKGWSQFRVQQYFLAHTSSLSSPGFLCECIWGGLGPLVRNQVSWKPWTLSSVLCVVRSRGCGQGLADYPGDPHPPSPKSWQLCASGWDGWGTGASFWRGVELPTLREGGCRTSASSREKSGAGVSWEMENIHDHAPPSLLILKRMHALNI